MKTTITATLLFFFMINGFTQDLNFTVLVNYEHPITKDKLSKARSMSDIIPYYPASWILSYNSAEISATSNGNSVTARGSDDILSEEQIKMLRSLELGTEIVIITKYQRQNAVTNEIENREMHYSATVTPETEAEYPDGYEQLAKYIKENAIDKISSGDSKDLKQAVVKFTVNEEGEIAGAQVSRTSGNPGIDNLLLDVIHNMPKWRPAEDSQGIKVKQEFEFTVGGNEGC